MGRGLSVFGESVRRAIGMGQFRLHLRRFSPRRASSVLACSSSDPGAVLPGQSGRMLLSTGTPGKSVKPGGGAMGAKSFEGPSVDRRLPRDAATADANSRRGSVR